MTYSKDEYDGVNTPMDMVITENGRFIFVINKGDDTMHVNRVDHLKALKSKKMKNVLFYMKHITSSQSMPQYVWKKVQKTYV